MRSYLGYEENVNIAEVVYSRSNWFTQREIQSRIGTTDSVDVVCSRACSGVILLIIIITLNWSFIPVVICLKPRKFITAHLLRTQHKKVNGYHFYSICIKHWSFFVTRQFITFSPIINLLISVKLKINIYNFHLKFKFNHFLYIIHA